METPQEFSARANALQSKATALSERTPDSDLSEWMKAAERRGMTWVDGLAFAIEGLKAKEGPASALPM